MTSAARAGRQPSRRSPARSCSSSSTTARSRERRALWNVPCVTIEGRRTNMARVPLTKEGVSSERLILNLEKVALSEDQFFQLCRDNSDLRLELTAQKELIIMPPAGLNSSWRNILFSTALANWSSTDGTGIP